jgi:hypothetical protein
MSKVSTIYDALVSYVETTLTAYKRMPNPYISAENAGLILAKGFGIGIGPGINTNRLLGCKMSMQRDFSIILVNQVTTTDHNVDARETLEKSIFEDQFSLIQGLEGNTTLGVEAIKCLFVSDNGLNYLESDRNKFFLLESNFTTEYLETINP